MITDENKEDLKENKENYLASCEKQINNDLDENLFLLNFNPKFLKIRVNFKINHDKNNVDDVLILR